MSTFDPSKVILMASAHDTLKNDAYDTSGSITIPGSASIAVNGRYLVTEDITIGEAGSIADYRFQTSRDTTRDYLSSVITSFTRTGSLGAYSIFVNAFHVDATTVRIQAQAPNPYGSTLTGQAGDETFTFKIRTFKAPF